MIRLCIIFISMLPLIFHCQCFNKVILSLNKYYDHHSWFTFPCSKLICKSSLAALSNTTIKAPSRCAEADNRAHSVLQSPAAPAGDSALVQFMMNRSSSGRLTLCSLQMGIIWTKSGKIFYDSKFIISAAAAWARETQWCHSWEDERRQQNTAVNGDPRRAHSARRRTLLGPSPCCKWLLVLAKIPKAKRWLSIF